MNLKDFKNKRICFLGLGLENLSLAEYLAKKGIKATVFDRRSAAELGERFEKIEKLGVDFRGGNNHLQGIADFDVIFRTPGFMDAGKTKFKKSAVFTSPMALFFDLCPAKIIAVTGTKGKGTASSLIFHILKKAGKNVWLAGNIGVAPFDFIGKIKADHFVILELSSFQLLDFRGSPHIAVVTNLFPDHLSPADPLNPIYHKSLKEYYGAKANIFLNQKKDGWLVVNKNSRHPDNLLKKSGARRVYFEIDDNLHKSRHLIGVHNQENIAVSCAVAKILGIPAKTIYKAVESFSGLEHHLEFVAEINGIRFYNDSASTMPAATLAAARAFSRSVILITGGVNKGYDLKEFAKDLLKSPYSLSIMLIGRTSKELFGHFKKMGPELKKHKSAVYYRGGKNIKEIIKDAMAIASKEGGVVLFSPGFASFDMFQNSKDSGKKFKEAVWELKSTS